ncbi:thiamine phosphate synthase [Exiguobacterium sp. s193]|uniref:thiamine phosphate synthase n=1 Tax=Exiguobacterium sp. s193 TaxID=2751207 RepID=UPI001BE97545|nr:thiamine phosphate synthase [Exiguobacterium sp. s193]
MQPKLHIVTTGTKELTQLQYVLPAVSPYADKIHIREPDWSADRLVQLIETLVDDGVPREKLIVHDRLDVALVTKTSVQLTSRSIPVAVVRRQFGELQIGRSIHSLTEALEPGSDFVMYGHVFRTASKQDVAPRGLAALAQIVTFSKVPVIAIGGVQPDNVAGVLATGVAGIAVMSGILGQENPLEAVKAYREVLNQ